MRRVFLLSPAHAGGQRARMLLRKEAQFPLARQLRQNAAPIGEVFAFLSGLYFRGKLAYVRAFAGSAEDALVITPNRGLVAVDELITARQLEQFGAVDIDHDEPRYRKPLERDLKRLVARFPDGEVVLLGSVATRKYTEPLLAVLGERLRFPVEFAGRGDMSRGGLLLRAARSGVELSYGSPSSSPRHGPRPPKLARVKWSMDSAALKAACTRLHHDAAALLVLLLERDGQELARAGELELDVPSLALLFREGGAALRKLDDEKELATELAAETKGGAATRVHISLAGARGILVVLFDERSSLGLVRLRARPAAEALRPLLAAIGPPRLPG